MNKNILLLAVLAPIAYGLFNVIRDKDCCETVSANVSDAEKKLKEFFSDSYDRLKLTEEQAEDIYEIISKKTTNVASRIKKLLTDEQREIYEAFINK